MGTLATKVSVFAREIFQDFRTNPRKMTIRLLQFAILVGSLALAKSISVYISLDSRAGFLEFKQAYVNISSWKISFYIHTFSSLVVFISGGLQFSRFLLTNYRNLHKFLGRIYVGAILFVNFPAAFILAIFANGGPSAKAAFVILDILWFYFTLRALRAVKLRRLIEHQEFMLRSYSLTLSALTLRMWTALIHLSVDVDSVTSYKIVAWIGFVPNLLLAEYLIRNNLLNYRDQED